MYKNLKVGKIQSYAGVRPTKDDAHTEVVDHFKYLGSLKSADGNCNNDIKSRVGMAKKIMLDMVPIWRDRGINKEVKMEVSYRVLVGADGFHLDPLRRRRVTKSDEKRIESAELWTTNELD